MSRSNGSDNGHVRNRRFDEIPYTDLSNESDWTVLGRGSFGRVFMAQYLGLDVAVKEVMSSGEYDVDKYFHRECTLMRECRHPNIVQFIGLCMAPYPPRRSSESAQPPANHRRILIVSEYLPNGNLRSRIRNSSHDFTWPQRISFAIDIARAIAYLHARDCLHRDLKGENLLLSDNDRIKVCDFGFARLAARNEEEMRHMSYCGTDGYMSPEILTNDEFGVESDIFSFGVILCEIAARKVVQTNVFERQIPSFGLDTDEIRQRASYNCPPDFVELCITCVKVKPVERPKIREILERLRQIEATVINEQADDIAYNVGSLRFAASASRQEVKIHSRSAAVDRRPGVFAPTALIPSAQPDSEDDELDEALEKLEKLQVGGKGTVYLNARPIGEAVTTLADMGNDLLSIYSVVKPSRNTTRLTVCDKPPSSVPCSSLLTVHGHASPAVMQSTQSLPSLPASWLAAGKQADADKSIDGIFASARSELQADRTIEKFNNVVTVETLKAVLAGKPNSVNTPTAELPKSRHATIRSLSAPVLATLESQGMVPRSVLLKIAPHRFTLIRPGWRALWEQGLAGGQVVHDKCLSKRFSGIQGSVSITGQLLGAGFLTRCTMCTKRMGLMKPYMACDDCRRIYHVRCGDLAVLDCGHAPAQEKEAKDGKTAQVVF